MRAKNVCPKCGRPLVYVDWVRNYYDEADNEVIEYNGECEACDCVFEWKKVYKVVYSSEMKEV